MKSLLTTDRPLLRRLLVVTFLLCYLFVNKVNAQCGFAAGLGCPGTDYTNYGFNSTPNATTLEYDNFISGFHATVIRNSDGKFQIWGQQAASNGTGSVVVPTEINSTNYPGLTGTPIRMAVGSEAADHQFIMLTTDGLFAWGKAGTVLSTSIKSNSSFGKITINGKSDGLPAGVSPSDVKMMFATTFVLAIVTCDGAVYVITNSQQQMQGDGLSLHKTSWGRVRVDASGNPYLGNVIAVRGNNYTLMALTSTNEVYTWGYKTLSGIESSYSPTARKYATLMKIPENNPIKMIGVTSYDKNHDKGTKSGYEPTYYILYSSGKIYSMGNNELRQLGDFTTTSTPSSKTKNWVQPRYPSPSNPNVAGSVMDNIKWISPNEHDLRWGAINVINNDGKIWNWGCNAGSMIGRTNTGQDKNSNVSFNPGQPLANTGFDPVTSRVMTTETGGHTTMIIQECQDNFGYVGHAIEGSTAAGTSSETYYPKFIFNTATIRVCGAQANPDISFANTPVVGSNPSVFCKNQIMELEGTPSGGVFSIMSGPGILTDGNLLTFTGGMSAGSVVVRYTVATSTCSNAFSEREISFEACTIYKIKGTVWVDENADAKMTAGEIGTNGAFGGSTGLWANLLDGTAKVIASVKVAADGTYELPVLQNGNYSVHITNEKIGVGASIPPSSNTLPAGWHYTGNNRSNSSVCVVPSCVNPNIISGVVLNNSDITGLNFGILGNFTITGTVFHDPNGLKGAIPSIDGIPVFTSGSGYLKPAQPSLYVAVTGTDGKVFYYSTVNNHGTYSVTIPAKDVVFQLTSTLPVVGSIPVQTLPANWVFVGENFGNGNGSGTGLNDGTGSGANASSTRQDGKIHVSFAGVNTTISGVDFGIELRPSSDPQNYTSISPGEFTFPSSPPVPGFPSVDSYLYIPMTNPHIGPLRGTDPEDCPTLNSCNTGSTFRINTIKAHTKLFYDFGGSIGVKEIITTPNPVDIPNFDPSKMVIYCEAGYGTTGSEYSFTYSLIDKAGIASNPQVYMISTFAILPVVVTHFDAVLKDDVVDLTWSTSSEENNKGFIIDKSTDTYTWNLVAEVASKSQAGYSNQVLNYQTSDNEKLSGTTYYRLKQSDLDGTTKIFGVRVIKISNTSVTVYPNPASSFVNISGIGMGAFIKVYDTNGRQVKSETGNKENYVLDITDLPIGIYNLLINDNGRISSFKLYKK